ncbi:2-phosphosulfolactate phosphatase [Rhodococcus sp. T2V]|uniref:2-phosphosulfolactate phosphatase n=1 Tax=Rhodococcus sp. T2V TaxID=3034164 RepID=UPI0023E295EC|nr:2-phosphosulfolactate phosphatase [Rhodococcus sp. T2V]MDF3313636.1 2-phosphosulfolactate phosphatase [Rhodococcus sp. T2V]
MNREHRQLDYPLRFEWGISGAASALEADVAVVVDVLSFTTTLSVAIDVGTEVLPYRSKDASAAQYASDHDAALAVGRRAATPGSISLSPGTIRSAQSVERLVLPSPNGSSIAYELGTSAGACVGASLRNARAVAGWIADNYPDGAVIAVIAAGEKWPDGSLRPAVEDLWGAGAVITALMSAGGPTHASPEAEVAAAAWQAVAGRASFALHGCGSGRELIADGFADDVAVAAEVDQSRSVPMLRDHRFVDARRR